MADIVVTGVVGSEDGTNLFNDLMTKAIEAAAQQATGIEVYGANTITPHIVALYDSSTANPTSRGLDGYGTLVGWFSLTDDSVTPSDPLRGAITPGLSSLVKVGEKSYKYTYAGEFGTVQALGTFDRMVLFGATRNNRTYRDTFDKSTLYVYNSFRKLGRIRVDDIVRIPLTMDSTPYNYQVASSFGDYNNGRIMLPKSLVDTGEPEMVVRVYSGSGAGIAAARITEEQTPVKEVTIDLPIKPISCWREIRCRLAPNGDIYIFNAREHHKFLGVGILRAADDYAELDYALLELPDEYASNQYIQFRIGEDGVLTVFYNTEAAPTTIKGYTYALTDLTTPTAQVLDVDMMLPITNGYWLHDVVIDDANQVAHVMVQKYNTTGGWWAANDNCNPSISSIVVDMAGTTPPVWSGLAVITDVHKDGTPNVNWGLGPALGSGAYSTAYTNVLDGGYERYNFSHYGQAFYHYCHKDNVLRGWIMHDGNLVEWSFLPVPHFTPALAVVDIPSTIKSNEEQMRAIMEITVTHS